MQKNGKGRRGAILTVTWLQSLVSLSQTTCPWVNMSATSSANARSPCKPWSCCAITVWVMTRWWLFTRPLFSVSCCTMLRRGGDSPAQPTNNVWRHQYDKLYVPACTRPTILHFYPRDVMLARVIEIATCLSVRPSRAGIVSKRRKLAAWFLQRLVAPRL